MDSDDDFDLETSRPLARIRSSQASSTPSQKSSTQQKNKAKQKNKKSPLQFVQKNNSQFKIPSQSRVITKKDKNSTNINEKVNNNLKRSSSFSNISPAIVNNDSSKVQIAQSQPNNLQKPEIKKWKRKSSEGGVCLEQVKKSRSEDGHCPFCQMPWCNFLISGRKKDFHNFECMDKELDDLPSCPGSLTCFATDENHFWSFQHLELAQNREEQERAFHRLQDSQKKTGQHSHRQDLDCDDHEGAGPSGWKPEVTKKQNSNQGPIEVDYDSDDSAVDKILDEVNYVKRKSIKGIIIRDESQADVNKKNGLGPVDRRLSDLKGNHNDYVKNHRKISIKDGVTVIADSEDSCSDYNDDDSDDGTVCSEVTKVFNENVKTVKTVNIQVKAKPNSEDIDFFSECQDSNINIGNKISKHRNSHSSSSHNSMSLLQQNGDVDEMEENQEISENENTSRISFAEKNQKVITTARQNAIINQPSAVNDCNSSKGLIFNSEEFETSTQLTRQKNVEVEGKIMSKVINDYNSIKGPFLNIDEFETSSKLGDANEAPTHEFAHGKKKNAITSKILNSNKHKNVIDGERTHFRRKDESIAGSRKINVDSNKSYKLQNGLDEASDNLIRNIIQDNDISESLTQVFNKKISPLTKENLDRQNRALSNKEAEQNRDLDMSLPVTQIFNGNKCGLRVDENIHQDSPDSSTILFDLESDSEGEVTQEFKEVLNKTLQRNQLEERMVQNDKDINSELSDTIPMESEIDSVLSDTIPMENSSAKSLEEYSGTRSTRKGNVAEAEHMTVPTEDHGHADEGSIVVDDDDDDDDGFNDLIEKAMEKYLGKDENKATKTPHKTPNKNESRTGSKKKNPCVHLHFHINSPSPSPKKGQTSILNFFQPKNVNKVKTKLPFDDIQANVTSTIGECSSSSEVRAISSSGREARTSGVSAAASWKPLMEKMMKLPSLSQSSGGSQASDATQWNNRKIPHNNQQRQQSWGQQRGQQWGQQQGQSQGPKKCPFYKYIPDTGFTVDAFCYGIIENVEAYFLTHFHYDHYGGLKKSFNRPIYLSQITANLVQQKIKVQDRYLNVVPMEIPTVVYGVEVTFLEANHCPGAVMILFKLRTGTTILHVGDFRAHSKMESYPALWNCTIDSLYLDTTYCNPVYDFPLQEDILEKCVSLAKEHVEENNRTLIVVGSYTIGKERVFKAIAEALDCRIWANNEKVKTLKCIGDKDMNNRITDNKHQARVHVVAMKDLQIMKLKEYILALEPRYNSVLAMKPTGWEYKDGVADSIDNLKPKVSGNVKIYGVPYSEHSSYNELRRFVQFTEPKKIIPTVNIGNPDQRKMMDNCFIQWRAEGKSKQSNILQLWGK